MRETGEVTSDSSFVFGLDTQKQIKPNIVRAAARQLPSEVNTPGGTVSGGYMIHFFEPVITAFHADVELGSYVIYRHAGS
ncbi:hypothetical protein BC938DRAFT_476396 [Jimgerdemannia flammicorona]|uniref:Uncharacterized protein n=1 Tax=Jimgerdemannia flammicorona TaxID=994334 RepID=A0A433PHH0_9FUNG|nr:hypothetical protein BC938DRAFT_476396 [Jimgerdemannia flammicorona]